jgi:hemolysin activation/secretion protein
VDGAKHGIRAVGIEGVTAFQPAEIEALTGNLTGPAVPEGQIEASRQALVTLYRSNGYLYTTARAVIRGSDLTFQVVEGYVAEVKLDGDVGPAGTQVLRFLNRLVGKKPLRTTDLERWLLLAQDIPGLTVRSTLNPSVGDPGVLTLIAQVSRRSVSGYFSADNRAYELTGPIQGIGVLNFDSFSELGERTQVSIFRTSDGTNIFGQLSSEFFLGGSGLKMKIYGGAGNSVPSGTLAAQGYNSDTRVVGLQLGYPLIRTRAQTLNLTTAFDLTETQVHVSTGPGGQPQRANYDSLRVLRLGADYALLDTLLGSDYTGVNGLSARFSQGFQLLGASRNHDTTTPSPRLGEQIDFTKIQGELSRIQTLFRPYDEATVALRGGLGWQYSGVTLPSSEKFYLGGPRFNRGYYYGQVSGDQAVSLSAELQLNTPLPTPAVFPDEIRAQFYAFYDWGKAWQNTRDELDIDLNSTGGGVRLYLTETTEVDLEGVYRISRFPTGSGPSISALRSAAFYWQVLVRF